MLTPHIPTNPYWLALPRGARVEIRPVMTAVVAAASARRVRRCQRRLKSDPWPVEPLQGLPFEHQPSPGVSGSCYE